MEVDSRGRLRNPQPSVRFSSRLSTVQADIRFSSVHVPSNQAAASQLDIAKVPKPQVPQQQRHYLLTRIGPGSFKWQKPHPPTPRRRRHLLPPAALPHHIYTCNTDSRSRYFSTVLLLESVSVLKLTGTRLNRHAPARPSTTHRPKSVQQRDKTGLQGFTQTWNPRHCTRTHAARR